MSVKPIWFYALTQEQVDYIKRLEDFALEHHYGVGVGCCNYCGQTHTCKKNCLFTTIDTRRKSLEKDSKKA